MCGYQDEKKPQILIFISGKDVHQKWKNLRTCFRRELNFQMLGKSVHAGKKRSKYVYFDELLFLLPNAQDKDTPTRCKYYTLQTSSLEEKRNEGVTVMDIPEQTKPPAVTPSCSRPKKRASCSYGESPLNISQNKNGSLEFDDDKSFLMSLLPSFKSLKADQKMDLRIEMMQLVRNFHRGVAEAPATQSELACSLAIE